MSRLLRQASDLAVSAYTPFGILVHLEPHTNFHRAVAFSVARVLAGEEDLKLSEGDLVFIMTSAQAQSVAAAAAAQLQSQAQAASVPPSEVTMALTAAATQATQTPVQTVAGTTSTQPANNAASIYSASNGGSTNSGS